jgi:hypothetical protein
MVSLSIEGLAGIAIVLVIAFAAMGIGASVLNSINNSVTSNGSQFGAFTQANNVVGSGMTGLVNLSSQGGLIGTVTGLGIVLAILLTLYYAFRPGVTGGGQ